MGISLKAARMGRVKFGIERSFTCPHPEFETQFGLINQFLAVPTLSRRNCIYAAKQVARMRDFPAWAGDIFKQKEIDYLDERVAAARERVKLRDEKRQAKQATVEGANKSSKKDTPVPALPSQSPEDIWLKALAEKKS